MTQVTLTGENFNESCTITFGAEPATNIVFVSPTEMTCDAPPQPAGTVDVTITDGITTSTLVAAYEYVAQINYELLNLSSASDSVLNIITLAFSPLDLIGFGAIENPLNMS